MTASPLVQITEATHDVVIDMMYARADNFTGQVIYDHSLCFLHPEAEAGLRRAVAAARGFGFKLKIFDAFRPHEAQEALWAVLPVPGYVADPAKGSNHTRGVAVDLTLLDADGQELDMGTPVDTMTPASHHFYADLPCSSPACTCSPSCWRPALCTTAWSGGTTSCPRRRILRWSAARCLPAAWTQPPDKPGLPAINSIADCARPYWASGLFDT